MRHPLPLLLVLVLVGCTEPSRPGAVEVGWRTGALSCGEAGVDVVRAELFDFGAATPSAAAATACDERELVVDDVEPGEYALVLKGLDVDGCWTHEARRDDLSVASGGQVEVEELALKRRTRPVRVRWPFANELDCPGNGVEQVEITIDVEDRFTEVYTFGCPGLARDIAGVPEGDARITVVAFDVNGDALAEGAVTVGAGHFRDEPCETFVEVRVALELCEEAGC